MAGRSEYLPWHGLLILKIQATAILVNGVYVGFFIWRIFFYTFLVFMIPKNQTKRKLPFFFSGTETFLTIYP